jgi:hypothetical protein
MKTTILRDGERYFGVDIQPDGSLIVYERANGRNESHARYPSGAAGVQALRRRIEHTQSHPHVCIRACGAAALTLMSALVPVRGMEVTLVSPRAIESTAADPEQRAERLARFAERLF